MAYIKNITFWHYGKNEGLLCDKCGAYITNVYTVTYSNGLIARYGMECFKKLRDAGKLSDFGMKILMKALRNIKLACDKIQFWQTANEEEVRKDFTLAFAWDNYEQNKDMSFEEYKTSWLTYWNNYLKHTQKEITRFSKINFEI